MSKKSKTSTTTSEATHAVQTPNNPQWVTDGLGGMGGTLSKLGAADPYSFMAGPDALQTQAGTAAGNLTTSPLYGDASALFKQAGGMGPNTYNPTTGRAATGQASLMGDAPQVQSASLLDNLGSYMSPYEQRVVDTTLAGFDQSAGYSRAGDALARAGDSTFGGSGGSIQTALNEQNIRQDRAQTEAQLRDQAFNTGAGLSGQDATRRQSASSENAGYAMQRALANQGAQNQFGLANMDAQNQFGLHNMDAANEAGRFNAGAADTAAQRQLSAGNSLAGLGAQQGSDDRANIATQSTMGGILQALAQQRAAAPLSTAGALTSMWGGLPLNLLHGQTADGTSNSTSNSTQTVSDPMGTLGGLLQAGGSLASGLGSMGLGFGAAGGAGGSAWASMPGILQNGLGSSGGTPWYKMGGG